MRALLAPSPYKESLKAAIIQQGIVLLLAAGILDGGDVFAICLIAVVAFWVGVWLVRRHRPTAPSRLDLVFIHWGYMPLCVMTFFLVHCFWRLRGLPGLL